MGKRLTIRLAETEWELLDQAAGGRPLASYARDKLLAKAAVQRKPSRRPQTDQVQLARILAALGSSDLAANMREIAKAARSGTLRDGENLALDIRAACLAIEKMRIDLTAALGVKPE